MKPGPFTPNSRLCVNSVGIHHCRPDWSMRLGPLTDFDLWTVFDGQGEVDTRGDRHEVRAGSALLLQPGEVYDGRHDPDAPLYVIAVHFDTTDAATRRDLLRQPLVHHQEELQFLEDLLQRAVFAFREELTEEAAGWLQAALQEVLNRDQPVPASGLSAAQSQGIHDLCNEIRRHPGRDYPLADLAAALEVTPDHFTRLFKAARGETPRDFVIRHRLAAARSLLRGSNYSIARVAEILGYRTVQYFSRQFLAKVGQTPGTYRHQGR